jgi:hypothetical protein
LEAEVRRLGARVSTGVDVTTHAVDGALRDGRDVLLATGSVPGPRNYSVTGGVVLEAAEVLAELTHGHSLEAAPGGGPVVVFDPVGDAVGVGVAELLASAGRETAIVSQDQVIGTQLALTGDLADANARLQRAGVRLEKRSLLREVRSDHVVVEDVFTSQRRNVPAGVVIHCGHRLPNEELPAQHPGLRRAGDCVAPRTVHEAVLEGRRVALDLGDAHQPTPALVAGGV